MQQENNEQGFITMIIIMLVIVLFITFVAYTRVAAR
jgi:hypothetical protein